MPPSNRPAHCQLCQRPVELTYHHLIPRKVHRRARFRKHFDRDTLNQGIWVCRLCHRGIHKTYDEMRLAKEFNSLSLIRADETIARHVDWVKKQKQAKS